MIQVGYSALFIVLMAAVVTIVDNATGTKITGTQWGVAIHQTIQALTGMGLMLIAWKNRK